MSTNRPWGHSELEAAGGGPCQRAGGRILRMPDIVDELTGWARNAGCDAMAADLVPGTTAAEREALAALGGLVRGAVGTIPSHWPEALKQWAEAGPAVPAEVLM